MSADEKKLLILFNRLAPAERQSLIAFAEFLCQRQHFPNLTTPPQDPLQIPRPAEESVPAALKRLRQSYHMLEASDLLSQAAELMMQHLLQKREAESVIDELEQLFEAHYRIYREK